MAIASLRCGCPPQPTTHAAVRYETPLTDVFSRQHKLELEWSVELALLKALGEVGKIPVEAHDEVKKVIECACSRVRPPTGRLAGRGASSH